MVHDGFKCRCIMSWYDDGCNGVRIGQGDVTTNSLGLHIVAGWKISGGGWWVVVVKHKFGVFILSLDEKWVGRHYIKCVLNGST